MSDIQKSFNPDLQNENKPSFENNKKFILLPFLTKVWNRWRNGGLVKNAVILTVCYALSRLTGFARTLVLYQNFDQLSSDLFLNADRIQGVLSTLFLIGSITNSVLPVAGRIEKQDDGKQRLLDFLNLIFVVLTGSIAILCLLAFVFTPQVLQVMISQNILDKAVEQGLYNDFVLSFRIMLIIPILFAGRAVLSLFLNLKEEYLVYGLSGLMTNIGIIIGLLVSDGNIVVASWWMSLSGIPIFGLFLWDSIRVGYTLPSFNLLGKWGQFKVEFGDTLKVFFPRIFLLDGIAIASLLLGRLAQNEGQNTAFEIATSIQGAFFIVISSFGYVIFPKVIKLKNIQDGAKNYYKQFDKLIKIGGLMGALTTIISVFGAIAVMFLFDLAGRGQGSSQYIIQIAQLSAIYLIFRALREVLSRHIFAQERQWQPMYLSMISVFAQSLFMFWLVWGLGFDAGLVAGFSLIINNLVWVVWCLIIYKKDRYDQI
jgi:putative peptidoglycan lipid II flippase